MRLTMGSLAGFSARALIIGVAAIPAILLLANLRPGAPAVVSSGGASGLPTMTDATATSLPADGFDWTLVGAGDIASCESSGDEATAALIEAIPEAAVFTAGDNAYPHASERDFADCYEPSWGAFRVRTRPAPGLHEYDANGAAAYFGYFGASAGPADLGYYSYEVGPWLVVVLNTNCSIFKDECRADSKQAAWLRDELKGHAGPCEVAISGHPRFSSGFHGGRDELRDLFQVLYDEQVEMLVSGHDHNYERFARLDADGFRDEIRGVRQFVVGTGGRSLRGIFNPQETSEQAHGASFGVLRLDLAAEAYVWTFLGVGGQEFDSGEGRCR